MLRAAVKVPFLKGLFKKQSRLENNQIVIQIHQVYDEI